MIEKLKNIPIDLNGHPSAVWLKINELVDAVNKLQIELKPIIEERDSQIKVYEEAQDMYDNAILDALKNKKVDVVVEPAENIYTKTCRMDKEFAEEVLDRTRKALDYATEILTRIAVSPETMLEPEKIVPQLAGQALEQIESITKGGK